MSLSNSVVSELKRFSNVPVFVGSRESTTADSISISPVKLDELVTIYPKIHTFTHTIWRNLPSPPDCEPAFVIMWMIASEGYDINHRTVSWEGTSANTFVHLWSTIDRLKSNIDEMTVIWLMGSRNPMGYAEHMRMPGAADMYLYPKEMITPPHIEVLAKNARGCKVTDLTEDFASFYDFRQSMMVPRKPKVMDVSAMMERSLNAMEKKARNED